MSNAETIEKTETEFSIPEGVYGETVTEVQHYTDRLFRFRITRPASFRFRSCLMRRSLSIEPIRLRHRAGTRRLSFSQSKCLMARLHNTFKRSKKVTLLLCAKSQLVRW